LKQAPPGRNVNSPALNEEPAMPPGPFSGRAMVVVNPAAGTGDAAGLWERLEPTLRDLHLDFEMRLTRRRGHAAEIGAEAASEGFRTVVVVGGDGTISEVVNGLMTVERPERPSLGIVPTGSGTALARAVGVPRDWQVAASLLASGRRTTIDVGRMEYRADGMARTGYFVNAASLGFDGEVARSSGRLPAKLRWVAGGTGSYLVGMAASLGRYREVAMELRLDEGKYRVLATTVLVANCSYLGGRFRVAPGAAPDDGLFDVVIFGAGFGPPVLEAETASSPPDRSRLQSWRAGARMARGVPRLFRGGHVEDASVAVMRSARVGIFPEERLLLQADGEVPGTGPLEAELIPGALDVIA